jgi:hypothetical protein
MSTSPPHATAASAAIGRQRGDGRRPSGYTYASASGHRNSTGHCSAASAAHAAVFDPGSPCRASSRNPSAANTTATVSGPTSRIHATRLPGCRSATNSPTAAGATIPSRNGAAVQASSEWCAPRPAATRFRTTAAVPAAAAAAAVRQASAFDIADDALASHALRPEC